MAPRAGLASHRKALSLHAICVAGGIEVPVLVPANESYAVPAGLRDRLFLLRDGNNPLSICPGPGGESLCPARSLTIRANGRKAHAARVAYGGLRGRWRLISRHPW